MTDAPRYGLICFDLGGVLVRVVGDWRHACRRAGVKALDVFDDPEQGRLLRGLNSNYEIGVLEHDDLIDQVCQIVPAYRPDQIAAILDAWLIDPYPGADEVLLRLAATGMPTACLSNTNALHWAAMFDTDDYPLLHRLQHRFGSCHIGARKPEQETYRHVERALGLEPQDILFFDDLWANVAAARRCGWAAELIDPRGDVPQQLLQHLQAHGVL